MGDNFSIARAFLKTLDPTAPFFTFQSFDDDRERRDPALVRVLHGTLEEHYDTLKALNDNGACISVNVQHTNGKGCSDTHIEFVRALYFDNDNGADIDSLPLRPSFLTNTSPGHRHLYFRLDENVPADDSVANDFRNMLGYLISKGSDPSCRGLSRAMRLPGFRNNRHEGRPLVTFNADDVVVYPWRKLIDVFRLKKTTEMTDKISKSMLSEKPFRIALLASALQHIDPSVERAVWWKIGAAIHYSSAGGDQGYDLFLSWSERGNNFEEKDWPTEWKSMGKYEKRPVTERYIYTLAKKNGWRGFYDKSMPAMPYLIEIERKNFFEWANERYAIIKSPTQVGIIYKATDDLRQASFNVVSSKDATLLFENMRVPMWSRPDKKGDQYIKSENLYKEWVKTEDRHEFNGMEFLPHKDIQIDKKSNLLLPNTDKFNTYLGLQNPGKKGEWDMVRNHILNVWCRGNNDNFEYVLNWLARVYQFPGEQGCVCVSLKSDSYGAGKNMIVDKIVKSFGRHGNSFSTLKHVTGQFNAALSESIFTVFEEAVWTGGAHAESFLNQLVTSEFVMSERKFYDTRKIKNCNHIFCLSNKWNIVPIKPGDRRYFILDCSNEYVNNYEYFTELKKRIGGDEGDALIWHLRHRDITNFNVFDFPREEGVRAMFIEYSLDGVAAFALQALEEGYWTFSTGYGAAGWIPTDGVSNVIKDVIYDSYKMFFKEHQALGKKWKFATKTSFGMQMKGIFPSDAAWSVSSKRVEGKTYPVHTYKTGDLHMLRKAFNSYLGTEKIWNDPEAPPPEDQIPKLTTPRKSVVKKRKYKRTRKSIYG